MEPQNSHCRNNQGPAIGSPMLTALLYSRAGGGPWGPLSMLSATFPFPRSLLSISLNTCFLSSWSWSHWEVENRDQIQVCHQVAVCGLAVVISPCLIYRVGVMAPAIKGINEWFQDCREDQVRKYCEITLKIGNKLPKLLFCYILSNTCKHTHTLFRV